MSWLTQQSEGVALLLHCQPGAKVSRIIGEHGGRLKIALNAPPVENRANEVLVAWLAEYFEVPRRQVQLVSGQTSRKKRVLVEGVTLSQARDAFDLALYSTSPGTILEKPEST
jgi:uncharacterized protein (TIGR00251 family)